MYVDLQQIDFRWLPRFSTLMAISLGNAVKIGENRTLKWNQLIGFKPKRWRLGCWGRVYTIQYTIVLVVSRFGTEQSVTEMRKLLRGGRRLSVAQKILTKHEHLRSVYCIDATPLPPFKQGWKRSLTPRWGERSPWSPKGCDYRQLIEHPCKSTLEASNCRSVFELRRDFFA